MLPADLFMVGSKQRGLKRKTPNIPIFRGFKLVPIIVLTGSAISATTIGFLLFFPHAESVVAPGIVDL